jgi:hypothetical protein
MGSVEEFLDFCERVDVLDDSENWSMTWLEAWRDNRSVIVRIGVDPRLDEVSHQVWDVGSRSVRAFSLMDFEFTAWTLSDDHALLWEYQEPFSQLNFLGPASSHEDVLCSLHERHRAVAGHWIPFERYINGCFLAKRLSGGSGLLADGPDRLMREYAAVLSESDLRPYFPYPPRPARHWDPQRRRWVDEQERLSALVLGASSYIVGTDFFANRVE